MPPLQYPQEPKIIVEGVFYFFPSMTTVEKLTTAIYSITKFAFLVSFD